MPPAPEPPPPAQAQPRAPGRPADERGVLIHALLERLDFRRPLPLSAQAIAAVAVQTGLAPPDGQETDELAGLLAEFAASDLCARLGRAQTLRREERFAFVLAGGVLITGALDVVAREAASGC